MWALMSKNIAWKFQRTPDLPKIRRQLTSSFIIFPPRGLEPVARHSRKFFLSAAEWRVFNDKEMFSMSTLFFLSRRLWPYSNIANTLWYTSIYPLYTRPVDHFWSTAVHQIWTKASRGRVNTVVFTYHISVKLWYIYGPQGGRDD